MSRITGLFVALATTAAIMTTSASATTAAGVEPPGVAELPREIPGGVELTLADGDTFRV